MVRGRNEDLTIPGLSKAVHSIVRTVVMDAKGENEPLSEDSLKHSVRVMLRRLSMMPRFLGLPMMIASVVFNLSGIFFRGKPFHSQTQDERRAHLKRWRSAPISFCENFVDFYEKMSTFVYFSVMATDNEQNRGQDIV